MSWHSPHPWSINMLTNLIYDNKGAIIGSMIPCDPNTPPATIAANVRVAAAAPQLLNALQLVEWGGSHIEFGTDHPAPACPFCNAMASSTTHTEDCPVMLALLAAKGGTP